MFLLNRSILATFVILGFPISLVAQLAFRPAAFAGLRVGRSTEASVRAKFGAPKQALRGAGSRTLVYTDIGPIKGRVEIDIALSGKFITGISLIPARPLTLAEIENMFGKEYRIGHFSLVTCPNDDVAPMKETPDGEFSYVIFDSLGVAAPIPVTEVLYLWKPLGGGSCPSEK